MDTISEHCNKAMEENKKRRSQETYHECQKLGGEIKQIKEIVDVLLYLCKAHHCDVNLFFVFRQLVYTAIESGCKSEEEKQLTLSPYFHL